MTDQEENNPPSPRSPNQTPATTEEYVSHDLQFTIVSDLEDREQAYREHITWESAGYVDDGPNKNLLHVYVRPLTIADVEQCVKV